MPVEKRDYIAGCIRTWGTKPELLARYNLHTQGLCQRLHAALLPGEPNVTALPGQRVIALKQGCV